MYALFAHLVSHYVPGKNRIGHAAVPRRLMENAEARAGSNPHVAAELRRAALAYLRVVR